MLTPEENAIRYHLYNQGLFDKAIAERVGVNYRSIAFWRQQRNLPANGGGLRCPRLVARDGGRVD